MDSRNPWFFAIYQPKERHWKVVATVAADSHLLLAYGPEFFPERARITVPAEDFCDDVSYLPYKSLVKAKKVAFSLPGKLFPEFMSGGKALRLTAAYYKREGKAARKED